MRALVLVALLAACGDNVLETAPACAELGCPGLDGTCKPSSCACAPSKTDEPIACVAYPACAELACASIACDGALCACEIGDGVPAICED